ncbi:phosphatidate cytidylyltransferase [Roseovarius sp. PS-C2]|uniref:phosphatidate cytidylyltransferase n=1 Tax=Roseovarius sp. PS-C2 TaxID=2820814 RepID=UPI001C0BD331|nr:phosphatidate cytidylyltransferase [Roseovarius sp. PS-C2]MBU3259658.1 phosphatidate cytidylyltransferase [Roseovarius sp. PS-C2]
MSAPAQWHDLAPRVLSGVAMAVAGAAAVWAGGWIFTIAVCLLAGLMIWECTGMFDVPGRASLPILGAGALAGALSLPGVIVVPLLVAVAFVGAGQAARDKVLYAVCVLWVLLGCYMIAVLRSDAGLVWVLWLVLVVVVSDVAGYFAGRMLGGPKFWPRVSPKKTWSGTAAGWIGAAVIGLIFALPTGAGWLLVPVSMLVGFAGQMGDIAESAVKRRVGVKDSSTLIPGHGGVLDRFDAMLGAGPAIMAIWALKLLPGLA